LALLARSAAEMMLARSKFSDNATSRAGRDIEALFGDPVPASATFIGSSWENTSKIEGGGEQFVLGKRRRGGVSGKEEKANGG
jgi:hypothetical protein